MATVEIADQNGNVYHMEFQDSELVWNEWITTNGTATTAFTDNTDSGTSIWTTWTSTGTTTHGVRLTKLAIAETEEEKQARLERERQEQAERRQRAERERARIQAEEAEMQRKKDIANQRARELLLTLLNQRQSKEYKDHGWFEVLHKGKRYRIQERTRVQEYSKEGAYQGEWCVWLRENYEYPPIDAMIAQKLTLEGDPARFFQTANFFPARIGQG